MASPVTFISGGRGFFKEDRNEYRTEKRSCNSAESEDSMDIQGAGAFTLSCLKEELGKMEGIEFVMFIPLGGEAYGR